MKGSNVSFNLQQFLTEMRTEQQTDHKELAGKLDSAIAKINDHETRIIVVEGTRRSLRWFGATAIVAVVGATIDFFYVHLPKLLTVVKP